MSVRNPQVKANRQLRALGRLKRAAERHMLLASNHAYHGRGIPAAECARIAARCWLRIRHLEYGYVVL